MKTSLERENFTFTDDENENATHIFKGNSLGQSTIVLFSATYLRSFAFVS